MQVRMMLRLRYEVVFHPNINTQSSESYEVECESASEAKKVLDTISNYTLMLHDKKIMSDYSNLGYIERKSSLVPDDWEEVNDDEFREALAEEGWQ